MKTVWFSFLLLILSLSIGQAEPQRECHGFFSRIAGSKLDQEIKTSKRVLNWNLFFTDRTLVDYISYLKPGFESSLERLKATEVWLDLGAGRVQAAEDFLSRKTPSLRPQVIAVTYKVGFLRRPPNFEGRLKILKNRFWEDIPSGDLPKIKLMTDVFGVLSYTHNLTTALEKIFFALDTGGELYIYLRSQILAIERDGTTISFETLLRSISGLEVEGRDGVLKITKTSSEIGEVPKMDLVYLSNQERPAFRRFRIRKN